MNAIDRAPKLPPRYVVETVEPGVNQVLARAIFRICCVIFLLGIAIELRAQESSRLSPLRESSSTTENMLRPLQSSLGSKVALVQIAPDDDFAVDFGLANVFAGNRIQPLNLNERSGELTELLMSVSSLRTQFNFRDRIAGGEPAHDSMTAPISNHVDPMVQVVSYLEPGFLNPQDEKQPVNQDETKPGDAAKPADDKAKPDEVKKEETNPLAVNALTVTGLTTKINDQMTLVKDNTSIDEATRAIQMGQLNTANGLVQQAAADKKLIEEGKIQSDNFDAKKKQSIADAEATLVLEKPDEAKTSEDLQMELQTKRSEYQAIKEERALIESQIQEHDKRIALLPGLRNAALNNLKTAKQNRADFKQLPNDVASSLIFDAKELAAQKRLDALTMESARQDQVGILLPLQRTILDKKLKKLETEITDWEAAYNRKRNEEIQAQKEKAEAAILKADPALAELAVMNQVLTTTRSTISSANKFSQEQLKKTKVAYEDVDKKLSDLQAKIDTPSGPSLASGVELVDFRQNLTYTFESQKLIHQIDKELEQRRLEALKLADDRKTLSAPDQMIDELWAKRGSMELPPEAKDLEEDKFRESASEIISQRLTYLTTLEKEYKDYRTTLIDHRQQLLNLVNKVKDARKYIDKKALWLKSANPVSVADLGKSARAFGSFFQARQWTELLGHAQVRITSRPYECALAGFVLIVMIIVSRRLRVQA